MYIEKEEIDSQVIGKPVLIIKDYEPNVDFNRFEKRYLEQFNPFYVLCKIPATDIESIHTLENIGFRYLEFQLRLTATVKRHDVSKYPYEFSEVSSPEELDAVLQLTSTIFSHDRFAIDPLIGQTMSGERYRQYVLKSYHDEAEKVYKLRDNRTGEIVGFSTNRQTGEQEALLLIGGISNELKTTGLGAINDYFALNELHRRGIRKFVTHVSGINYPIMNLEIKGLGFRIMSSFVVLRKVYPSEAEI